MAKITKVQNRRSLGLLTSLQAFRLTTLEKRSFLISSSTRRRFNEQDTQAAHILLGSLQRLAGASLLLVRLLVSSTQVSYQRSWESFVSF